MMSEGAGSHLKEASALRSAPALLLLLERLRSLRAPRRPLPLLLDQGGSAGPQAGCRPGRVGPLSDGEHKARTVNARLFGGEKQQQKFFIT